MVFKSFVRKTQTSKSKVKDKMKFQQKKKHGSDKNCADYS